MDYGSVALLARSPTELLDMCYMQFVLLTGSMVCISTSHAM